MIQPAQKKLSKNFEDFLKEKDNPVVFCTLQLDGNDFLETSHFTLDLKQIAGDHDQFSISVLDDALDTFEGEIMENSKSLLGKRLNIYLHRFGEIQFTFEGIITSVKNRKENGYGNLLIEGHSPTILLENGEDCQSFEKKTLKQIIEEATAEYHGKIAIQLDEVNFNVKNRGLVFPYVVQYKESDFQFLKRIASRYGEWLFYDGVKLVVGAKPYQIIELQENVDLIDVEFKLSTAAQKYKYIAYDRHLGDNREKKSNSIGNQTRANHLQVIALNASNDMFSKVPELLFNQEADELSNMLDVVMWRKNEANMNVMHVKGRSRNPEVAAGRDIRLRDINDRPMETYRIMNVRHYHNGAGEYYNEFEAVPFDTWIPPYFNENAIPLCEEQSAIVMDNNDPDGMSRIRVQFPWQISKGGKSPWLRVVTPYAGKGKGMHILPEIGEEVIVGFENGNAEKPFVIGTMFHGKGTSGHGGEGNFVKGLQTASGQRLQMNDKEGSLLLQDNGNASMKFDGGGNATTNAASTNVINVGGQGNSAPQSLLKMDAGGNIVLDGKSSITFQVGGNKIVIDASGIKGTVGSGNVDFDVSAGSFSIKSKAKVDISSDADIKMKSKTNLDASADVSIKMDSKNELNVNSKTANIAASGNMTIKGADVEINKG